MISDQKYKELVSCNGISLLMCRNENVTVFGKFLT